MGGQMFEVKPNFLLTNEHPNLVIMPMLHQVTRGKTRKHTSKSVKLSRG